MKLSCRQAFCTIFSLICLSFLLLSFIWNVQLPYDIIKNDEIEFGSLHITVNLMWIIVTVVFGAIGLVNCNPDEKGMYFNENEYLEIKMSSKKIGFILTAIFMLFFIFAIGKNIVSTSIEIYNSNIEYVNQYEQKSTERKGYYDKLWKIYLQKSQITELNKDVFIQVTKSIMEGRSDGSQVAWKWVKENQQIPYNEFTKFYSDLSTFIASQREGYFDLEKQCMEIAKKNNTMLSTFPNNLYNKFLNCEKIKFNYGFTSSKTKTTFETGEENL